MVRIIVYIFFKIHFSLGKPRKKVIFLMAGGEG